MKTQDSPKPPRRPRVYLAIASAFAGVAVLLVTAGYVIHRLVSDRAYYEKWKLYDDCGWS